MFWSNKQFEFKSYQIKLKENNQLQMEGRVQKAKVFCEYILSQISNPADKMVTWLMMFSANLPRFCASWVVSLSLFVSQEREAARWILILPKRDREPLSLFKNSPIFGMEELRKPRREEGYRHWSQMIQSSKGLLHPLFVASILFYLLRSMIIYLSFLLFVSIFSDHLPSLRRTWYSSPAENGTNVLLKWDWGSSHGHSYILYTTHLSTHLPLLPWLRWLLTP